MSCRWHRRCYCARRRWPGAPTGIYVQSGHFIENSRSLPHGASGNLVCPGLLNADMPLIRYRTGDGSALADGPATSQCGHPLPVIESVDGQVTTFSMRWTAGASDGLIRYSRVTFPFTKPIIQEALDCVRVQLCATRDFRPEHESVITQRLTARMGRVKIAMKPIAEVPREPNGKFRAAICKLSKEGHWIARPSGLRGGAMSELPAPSYAPIS